METHECYIFGSSERDFSKVEILRGLIAEKMTVAVREILAVVEATVHGYENEVSILKRELSKKEQLDSFMQPRVYLERIDLDPGVFSKRYVKKVNKNKKTTAKWKNLTKTLEQTGKNHEESDCIDLLSDAPASSGSRRESDLQKARVKRRRRVPKRYRSDNEETDSDAENKQEKLWEPNQSNTVQSTEVHKDHVIKLSIGLLDKCSDKNQPKLDFSPSQTIFCQQNLSESDFFKYLRSTFPELKQDKPMEAILLEENQRSVPHTANWVTQYELYKAFKEANNYLSFCVHSKEPEDTDMSTSSLPSASFEEQPSATLELSKLTDERVIFSSNSSSADVLSEEDNWKLEENNEEESNHSEKIKASSSGSCKVCGLSLKSKKILTKHALCHLDNLKSMCGVCGLEMESSDDLKRHLETHQKLHHCETCGRYFLTFITFQKHVIACQFKNGASNRQTLTKKMYLNVKPKLHKCSICSQSFRSTLQLYVHKNKHTGGKTFQCEKCGESISSHRHRRSQCEKGLCKFCGKLLKLHSLKNHEATHCEGEKKFVCDICSKTFFAIYKLKAHQRRHNPLEHKKCQICNKLIKNDLESHIRVHTGERPFSCKLCKAKFKSSSNLRTHMKTHLGKRPFACTKCEYTCTRSEHLKMHMRTHTGQKPYKCTMCDKAFTQQHCLNTHLKCHKTKEQSAVDTVKTL